ncbi:hypothetical protein ACL6C3_14985 [Capilliphycus salinus ALCB114379]|uniref:hypothetical protein n=1 Tax=Capilliphycus salinus TaxID=2768948 RepID=UPI0039A66D71
MNVKHFLTAIAATALTATPVLAESPWAYMGESSSGESVYVNNRSMVFRNRNYIEFTYQIGGEVIQAVAYCDENRWYASGYGTYSPQSRATQNMINFVCSAG